MARLPKVSRESFPDELQYVWDRTATNGKMPNIFSTMGNNPALLRSYLRLGNGLWSQCGLDVPTRELAILRTAILHHSTYEWHQHVRLGRAAGLNDERIVALHHWRTSDLFSEPERAVLGYVDAVAASEHPPADVHDALAHHFGPSTMVGVNLLAGFYGMTAKYLGAMEVETEEPFVGWELQGS
jgi:alkylhydroperoxidase family enzyme